MTTLTYQIEIGHDGAYRPVLRMDGADERGGDMRHFIACEMRYWRQRMLREPGRNRPRVRLVTWPAKASNP